MKSRESAVRVKEFAVREKRRRLAQLDLMIAEFNRMADDLTVQIELEERKAGITDEKHFAYPTFAKAARLRRENVLNSRLDLAEKRAAAVEEVAAAEGELARAEALDQREGRTPSAVPERPSNSGLIG
jgi:flagellar protein FliJ